MGQISSVEAREEERFERLIPAARQRLRDLSAAANAERKADIPPEQGSAQARLAAGVGHTLQLTAEHRALLDYTSAYRNLKLFMPKVPKPTPPWEEVEAALSVVAPSTPAGGGAPVHSRRWDSSNDAAVPADVTNLCEAAQLLPSGAGPSAPGLRWRLGHEKGRS